MAQSTNGLEAQIHTTGVGLWNRIRGEVPGIFNRGYWQGRMLEWAMADPSFKIDLFRFVDVLPMLQSTEQVSSHMRQYLLKEGTRAADDPGDRNQAGIRGIRFRTGRESDTQQCHRN